MRSPLFFAACFDFPHSPQKNEQKEKKGAWRYYRENLFLLKEKKTLLNNKKDHPDSFFFKKKDFIKKKSLEMKALFLLVVVLMLLLPERVCAEHPSKDKKIADKEEKAANHREHRRERKVRSLVQACKKEAARLCPSDKHRSYVCLSEKKDEIEDVVCKQWITARDACMEAVKDCVGKSKRACLRLADKSTLPKECVESDFFKSVESYGVMRQRDEIVSEHKKKRVEEAATKENKEN